MLKKECGGKIRPLIAIRPRISGHRQPRPTSHQAGTYLPTPPNHPSPHHRTSRNGQMDSYLPAGDERRLRRRTKTG